MKVIYNDKWLNRSDNKCYIIGISGPEHYLYGKSLSEKHKEKLKYERTKETKQKMRESRKKLFESGYKNPNPALRDDVKEKFKIIMTEKYSQSGKQNRNWKGRIETPFGIFDTQKEAAKLEGVSAGTISLRINDNENINYRRII
jgi:hypothetical protein